MTEELKTGDTIAEGGSNAQPVTKRKYRSRSRRRKRKSKRPKPPVAMRQCALPDCGEAFYPQRRWQRFHTPACAVKDRQRRFRERYRKLISMNRGDITEGAGGRKVISRRGSKELTRAETNIIAELRRGGAAAVDMVTAILADPPRNRSPEQSDGRGNEASPAPAIPSPPMISHRLRNVRRVHPRSLENT
jgi:hypothetical protein